MINKNFWNGKKVLVTGHTGFKGSWISLWLTYMGARVTGYALNPPTNPNLFELCKINELVDSVIGDVRDLDTLTKTVVEAKPEIVIHMAAQPLVRESYKNPVLTYGSNVMGTVNVLEAVRHCNCVKAVVNVTTDKCYENENWVWGYRENDSLGGYDPYSNSKACSEMVTACYRNSFFSVSEYHIHGVGLASARAGNVIGGGDWAVDRLVPDCVRSLIDKKTITIRNPKAVRPWQHVLEPLSGYLLLAQKLYENGPEYAEGWNFGPEDIDAKSVQWVVEKLCSKWGQGAGFEVERGPHPYEAHYLKLDISKAKNLLQWQPRWHLETAIDKVIEWTLAYINNLNLRDIVLNQIRNYETALPLH